MTFKPPGRHALSLCTLFWISAILSAQSRESRSFYTLKPEDAQAVYLLPDVFPVHADGIGDDSETIQLAVDTAEKQGKFGIVLIPEGLYRITRTIHVWKGIRLIGYGAQRPVILLGENTPGFSGDSTEYMIHFVSSKPREGRPMRDANPGTFYSALSNIDITIESGNQEAVAVRSHFAQHCFLAHIDFHIGDALAGVDKVGNEIEDCRFFGGEYGIMTTKPSPSWPFLLIDCAFEGQRSAAVETEEGGMTLIRCRFKNVPHAVSVRPDRAEELFMEDCRFETITQSALVISDEMNARSQTNVKKAVCINVPVFAAFRESGRTLTGNTAVYGVNDFIHGNQIPSLDAVPQIKTSVEMQPLAQIPEWPATDIPPLPAQETWMNIVSLGAAGDNQHDNTGIIQEAIDTYETLYFPTGRYRVTETIRLKPNTVLIGLSPITTQLVLHDRTPAFQGPGSPKALLETPPGGTNIVTGIGLDAGAVNSRAVAAKWMAGTHSMMNDVKFLGGHGTYDTDGNYLKIYNNNRTADADPERKWDSQYWSLWITDGGGGTFKDIWTASPFAMAGVYISNTDTEGRIYAMSVEHHVRYEVQLKNMSNWKLYALQMEEERGEGWNALPVEIENCSGLRFANLYLYRSLMQSPFPNGISVQNSRDLEFCGIHVYSPTRYTFDNTLYDAGYQTEIRSREIANLKISGHPPGPRKSRKDSPVLARGASVEKLAGGFEFIVGAAADAHGNVCFTDGRWHAIYKWSAEKETLAKISDLPVSPVALAFDKSGNLLVTTLNNEVLLLDPEQPAEGFTIIQAESAADRPEMTAMLPAHLWKDAHDFLQVSVQQPENHFISPDSSIFIPYFKDLRRAYALRPARAGVPYLMADEFGQKTYAFEVRENGQLNNPRLVAEEGEFDIAVDSEGHVYVAAGDLFVYDQNGGLIERIFIPERPATIVFGGKGGKDLFITARSSLYRIQTRFAGLDY